MGYGGTKQRLMPFEREYLPRAGVWVTAGTATNASNALAWSPDGNFIAVPTNVTPYLSVYRVVNGSVVEKMANPASLPVGVCNGVKWNNAGTYIAAVNATTPYFEAWAWSSSGFGTKVTALSGGNIPSAARTCLAWSADDAYIVAGGGTTPYMDAYPFTTGFGTRIANPGTVPAGTVNGIIWAGSSIIIATNSTTPFVQAWPFAAGAFGTIWSAASAASGAMGSIVLSDDNTHVIVSGATTPFIQSYEISSSAWLAGPTSPNVTPAAGVLAAQLGYDAVNNVIIHSSGANPSVITGHIMAYYSGATGVLQGATFSPQPSFGQSAWYGFALSPNRKYLAALGPTGYPYIRIFSWLVED